MDNNEGTGKNEHIRERNKVMGNEVEMNNRLLQNNIETHGVTQPNLICL